VVVLSLIILVVIVSNVILWSYQMNQLDWDKTQETIAIAGVSRITHSSWFTVQGEFVANTGSRTGGSYVDTQAINGSYESFRESNPPRTLDINGTFTIDYSEYPSAYIQSVEVLLRYAASDAGERWYIKAYDWTTGTYSSVGFNSTSGSTPSAGWSTYSVNLTNQWQSYLSTDGKMFIKIHDEGLDSIRTSVDIDFLAVRVVGNGSLFTFQNKGSRTIHLVSLWIANSMQHRRYDMDEFVNSGETSYYLRPDISLPFGSSFTVKVITERGNSAIYTDA
jgi:hypothetical protein